MTRISTSARVIGLCMAASFAASAAFAHEQQKGAKTAQDKPAASHAQHSMPGHQGMDKSGHSMAGHSPGSMELHHIMMDGQKMPMPMSGNVDKDFATMMTMHHQQAIKMTESLIKHGKNAELKALARKMQTAQREEIKKMAPHTK